MPQHPASRKTISWKLIIPLPILGLCSVLLFYALGMPLKEALFGNIFLDVSLGCFIALIVMRIALNRQNREDNTSEG